MGGTPAMRIQPLLFTFFLVEHQTFNYQSSLFQHNHLVLSDQLVFELAGDALQLGEVLQRVAGAGNIQNWTCCLGLKKLHDKL